MSQDLCRERTYLLVHTVLYNVIIENVLLFFTGYHIVTEIKSSTNAQEGGMVAFESLKCRCILSYDTLATQTDQILVCIYSLPCAIQRQQPDNS